MVRIFRFRFSALYRTLALPWGVTPRSAAVRLDDRELQVRFGPWRVRTPRSNIAGVHVTGPYSALKTAGPAHLSLADRGMTMATNGERGVCICFHEPVRGLEPTGRLRHPALTVTVEEPEALVAALGSLP